MRWSLKNNIDADLGEFAQSFYRQELLRKKKITIIRHAESNCFDDCFDNSYSIPWPVCTRFLGCKRGEGWQRDQDPGSEMDKGKPRRKLSIRQWLAAKFRRLLEL